MYRSLQKQLIIWTSVLVVGLGAVVALVCLQPPPQESALFMSRAYARAHRPASVRLPAATGGQENAAVTGAPVELAVTNRAKALEVTLGCDGQPKSRFENAVNQIRVSGHLCRVEEEILSSEIRNETNNTSATVFFPTASSYTTDYISLATGANRIRILNILKSGGREDRELWVERAPADEIPTASSK